MSTPHTRPHGTGRWDKHLNQPKVLFGVGVALGCAVGYVLGSIWPGFGPRVPLVYLGGDVYWTVLASFAGAIASFAVALAAVLGPSLQRFLARPVLSLTLEPFELEEAPKETDEDESAPSAKYEYRVRVENVRASTAEQVWLQVRELRRGTYSSSGRDLSTRFASATATKTKKPSVGEWDILPSRQSHTVALVEFRPASIGRKSTAGSPEPADADPAYEMFIADTKCAPQEDWFVELGLSWNKGTTTSYRLHICWNGTVGADVAAFGREVQIQVVE